MTIDEQIAEQMAIYLKENEAFETKGAWLYQTALFHWFWLILEAILFCSARG